MGMSRRGFNRGVYKLMRRGSSKSSAFRSMRSLARSSKGSPLGHRKRQSFKQVQRKSPSDGLRLGQWYSSPKTSGGIRKVIVKRDEFQFGGNVKKGQVAFEDKMGTKYPSFRAAVASNEEIDREGW